MIKNIFKNYSMNAIIFYQITQIYVHDFVVGTKNIFYGRFEVCTKLDVAIMFFVIRGTKIYN